MGTTQARHDNQKSEKTREVNVAGLFEGPTAVRERDVSITWHRSLTPAWLEHIVNTITSGALALTLLLPDAIVSFSRSCRDSLT